LAAQSPPAWMVEELAGIAGVEVERIERLLEKKSIRFMEYRGLPYFSFRKKVGEVDEGTCIIMVRGAPLVVPGYPHIARIGIVSRALPRHFPGMVAVEEKMNGYNVRALYFQGMVLGITRRGLICPYTSIRLAEKYGEQVKSFYTEHDPYEYTLYGEVVGTENPYVRVRYPEAPGFGYFVFDMARKGRLQPLEERDGETGKHGIPVVRRLATIDPHTAEGIGELWRILDSLGAEGREGVVLKDPMHRVEPLKYTTTAIDLADIEAGMRYFADEGRDYLYSRLVRIAFRLYERGVDPSTIAARLGEAVLKPMIEAIREVAEKGASYEEFTLPFPGYPEAKEYVDYMERLGLELEVVDITPSNGRVLLRLRKPKPETSSLASRILSTGLIGYD